MSVLLVVLVLFGFGVSGVRSRPEAKAKVFAGSGSFSTIQAAINAANETDIVQVMNGIYYGRVVVNKSISLVGEDWTTTIIDGEGSGEVIRMTANNVRITGFTIRNGGISGISIADCHSQNISGNLVSVGGTGLGIDVKNSSHNVFLRNNVTACGWPIKLEDSDGNRKSVV